MTYSRGLSETIWNALLYGVVALIVLSLVVLATTESVLDRMYPKSIEQQKFDRQVEIEDRYMSQCSDSGGVADVTQKPWTCKRPTTNG